MLVSIVVPSYSMDNYYNLRGAIDSLLNQSYPDIEIIVVIDMSKDLYSEIAKAYAKQDKMKVIFSEQSLGAAAARNVGIKNASGDILAFIDDDAIADERWVEELVNAYKEHDVKAVCGKILPLWLPCKPEYFPDELYWLVGVTHKGFSQDRIAEVRNAFGANMSFRREVFDQVGLFNESFGFVRQRARYIQSEEVELSLRMTGKFGVGVIYNPAAIVHHKIPVIKTRLKVLLKRSFYQGYSKALLWKKMKLSRSCTRTEETYLKELLLKYIPRRIKKVFSGPGRMTEIRKISILLYCIIAVGLGFVHGHIRRTK